MSSEFDQRLKLKESSSTLSPYVHQTTTWDRMSTQYLEADKAAGLVVLPTGGGKTVVAAHWLLRKVLAHGGRVLWLAGRQSLLRQAFKTFKDLANLSYPDKKFLELIAVSSEFHRWGTVSHEHDVVFASSQSSVIEHNRGFVREFLANAKGPRFVVIDEAHHAVAPRTLDLLKELKATGAKLLGLTATPIRTDPGDEKRLSALFDANIIHQVSRTSLTNLGILAAPSTETIKTEINIEREMTEADLKHLETYGELGPQVLARLGKNAPRNRIIVEQYVQNKERYGPTIVFAADILPRPDAGSGVQDWRHRAHRLRRLLASRLSRSDSQVLRWRVGRHRQRADAHGRLRRAAHAHCVHREAHALPEPRGADGWARVARQASGRQ